MTEKNTGIYQPLASLKVKFKRGYRWKNNFSYYPLKSTTFGTYVSAWGGGSDKITLFPISFQI